MTTSSLISDEMRGALGSVLDRVVSYPVPESDIRKWALAVYYPEEPPKIFWDAEYAAGTVFGGIVAPEEFNPFAWMTAEPSGVRPKYGPDGPMYEERLGLSAPDTSFMLNGGIDVRFGVRIRPGDVVTSVTRLSAYTERQGRLGLMLFTTTTTEWTNQRGELIKSSSNTVIRY